MRDPRLRVLIVDDHPMFRHGVKSVVRRLAERAVIVEADTFATTCRALEEGNWSLIVLDLILPGGEGDDLVSHARRTNPSTPIVVCTIADEGRMGSLVLECGANGYVSKTSTRREMESAFRAVLTGGTWFTPPRFDGVATRSVETIPVRGGVSALSPMEKKVLKAFGGGRSQKEIAADLDISASSVGTYRARILSKLGLRTTSELLCFVAENRLGGNSRKPWERARDALNLGDQQQQGSRATP